MLFMQPDGVFNTTLYQDVTYTTCGCKVRNQCTLNHALAVFIAAPPTLSYVCACVVYTRSLKLWNPENYTIVHVLGLYPAPIFGTTAFSSVDAKTTGWLYAEHTRQHGTGHAPFF